MGRQLQRPYNADNAGDYNLASAEIRFSDTEQAIVDLPAGAVVTRVWAQILEAFNAGTNDLTVGITGQVDRYMAAAHIDEGTVGVSAARGPFAAEGAAVTAKAFFAQTGAAATAGRARLFVEYVRLTDNG